MTLTACHPQPTTAIWFTEPFRIEAILFAGNSLVYY